MERISLQFIFKPMNQHDARTIASWHYGGIYAFYDPDQDVADLEELLNPDHWPDKYYVVVDERDELIGFFCFEPKGEVVQIGLGLRPEYTGKGLGLAFVEAGLACARQKFTPTLFCLNVAAFNQRAIRTYVKAGFKPTGTLIAETNDGRYEFLHMERDARLSFRSICGEEDADALYAVHTGRIARDGVGDTTALLQHEGYAAAYTVLEMDYDLSVPLPPLPPLPPGVVVRPMLPEHIPLIAATVREAYQNEYADGRFQETIDPTAYTVELSTPKNDPGLWQVGWEGDQVAGQVLSRIENGRAEVFEVSVRPAWRRQKLGRALQGLRERDVKVIRLRTVSEFLTRASDLYCTLGFRVLKEFPRYRKTP